jgi:hypothetical protein
VVQVSWAMVAYYMGKNGSSSSQRTQRSRAAKGLVTGDW